MTTICAPPAVPGIIGEERRYARNAHAPGIARRAVRAQLMEWRLDQVIDTAELVASELVTNSVLHGGGDEIALRLETSGGVVCVRVWDGSLDLPGKHDATGEDETGRGLAIVDALALEWGTYPADEGGKVTWATIAEATAMETTVTEAGEW